jgi:hypothetical protein
MAGQNITVSRRFPTRQRNAETPEELLQTSPAPAMDPVNLVNEAKPVLLGIVVISAFFLVLAGAGILWSKSKRLDITETLIQNLEIANSNWLVTTSELIAEKQAHAETRGKLILLEFPQLLRQQSLTNVNETNAVKTN